MEDLEVKAFDQEFNSMLQESATQARKEIGNPLAQQRKEIPLPFGILKNKQKESDNRVTEQSDTISFQLITNKGG